MPLLADKTITVRNLRYDPETDTEAEIIHSPGGVQRPCQDRSQCYCGWAGRRLAGADSHFCRAHAGGHAERF